MEKILHGIPKVIRYLDVLITAQNDEEHLKTLQTVLCCLSEHGLRLKKSKCEFLKTRVEYLGYCIDADGLHKSPAKVKAIVDAPRPQNQQLWSFLGLVKNLFHYCPQSPTPGINFFVNKQSGSGLKNVNYLFRN